jgi:protein SCO1/2
MTRTREIRYAIADERRGHMARLTDQFRIPRRLAMLAGLTIILFWSASATPHQPGTNTRLSKIGPAPDFALTTQDGRRLSLRDLRGKVVAVTFIYASCADTCPLLTAKMAAVQNKLGDDFGARVFFASVTVDPTRDTPDVLRRYAKAHGAKLQGWAFLSGRQEEIREVTRRYGIYYRKDERGDVDHTFLTSVIDASGVLRVQYVGVRFDPDELLRDLHSLVHEAKQ